MSRAEAPTERLARADEAATARLGEPARGGGDGPAPRAPGGLVLGRYRLAEQLGAGAFGAVWRAWDERLERDVAIKVIADGQMEPGRAAREVRAAARLSHPAIVALYEAEQEDGATYLVSELVRGATLAELLADGALSDRDVAEIGLALCAALAHAHAHGVVHRDVKPSNVLVPDARAAGAPAAKLTDFGVARVVGAAGDALTRTGDVVGTLAYMAPEQAEGRAAEAPADLYAAALVLYEGFAGVNPVRGGSAAATARKLGAILPSLRRQRPDLPRALCEAIDRALRPRAGERGSVADLGRALRDAIDELDDEPGTVAAPIVERAATAVTQVADVARRQWRRRSREQELAAVAAELGTGAAWADELGLDAAAARDGWEGEPVPERRRPWAGSRRPPAPLVSGHVLPGVVAGALVVVALEALAASTPPVQAPLAGALAAVAVGLLPRLGWLAVAAVLVGWVAGGDALDGRGARPGAALLLAAALAPIPPLLPLRGRLWSVPLAAPLLGAALLAGAYPALAGQAGTLWRRAALGALGFWALLLAEPLLEATLFYGAGATLASAGAWEGSPTAAVSDVLRPLVDSGALACAGLWAAGAAVLPWLVRGRRAALDLVAATVWAAALAAGAGVIGAALGPGAVAQPDPRGAALGAAAGVLIAVAARAARGSAAPARGPGAREPAVA